MKKTEKKVNQKGLKIVLGIIYLLVVFNLFVQVPLSGQAMNNDSRDSLLSNDDIDLPQNLSATYGEQLKDVVLPEDWRWENPDLLVGNANLEGTLFSAFYTNGVDEYQRDLLVVVKKMTISPRQIKIVNGSKQNIYVPKGSIVNTILLENEYNFTFSLQEEGEYNQNIQLPKQNGDYTIYYRVEGANIEPINGSFTVTINGYQWSTWIVVIANVIVLGLLTTNIIINYKLNKQSQVTRM